MATPLPRTPGDLREDHAIAAGEQVAAIYAQAEMVLIATAAALARKVASGHMPKSVAAARLIAVARAVFAAARSRVQAAVSAAMTSAGQGAQAATAGGSEMPFPDASGYAQELAYKLDDATGNAFVSLQDAFSAAAGAAAETTAPQLTAGNIFQQVIADAIGSTRGGLPASSLSLSRIQAAQKALDDFAAKGITGFTDRLGRNWDLASYTEMATRKAVSNAWDDMQAQAMIRSGLDLVEIGTYSTEGSCSHCRPWLGKTVSLTGATPGYPTIAQAKASGWMHPNCRCYDAPAGANVMADFTNPVDLADSAAAYAASQRQRALERNVRAAGRQANAAITPAARAKAQRGLAAARQASAAHRGQEGVVMTKVSVQRRERPFGPR